jgi:hypothetical protein
VLVVEVREILVPHGKEFRIWNLECRLFFH